MTVCARTCVRGGYLRKKLYIIGMNYYHTCRENTEQFLSVTSLYPEEFDFLLPYFAAFWYKYHRIYTTTGKRRKIKKLRPKKDTKTLPTVEDKLFFLLVYLKQHPLQQFQAMVFEMSQGKASRWIKLLTPILEDTLRQIDCMACRDGAVLKEFAETMDDPIRIITQDVVEQTTPRSTDAQAQEKQYSGKKKTTPIKTK